MIQESHVQNLENTLEAFESEKELGSHETLSSYGKQVFFKGHHPGLGELHNESKPESLPS